MTLRQVGTYLRRLAALAGGNATSGNAVRFAMVGLLGLGVDVGAFQTLWNAGLGLSTSHMFSFLLATAVNYVLNSRWAFRASCADRLAWGGYARFLTVCLMALFLRGGVLALLVQQAGWPTKAALCSAIFVAAVVNYLGSAFFVFPHLGARTSINWRIAAIDWWATRCFCVLCISACPTCSRRRHTTGTMRSIRPSDISITRPWSPG